MYELDKISCVNCIVVSAKISLYFASAFILELTNYFFINVLIIFYSIFSPQTIQRCSNIFKADVYSRIIPK